MWRLNSRIPTVEEVQVSKEPPTPSHLNPQVLAKGLLVGKDTDRKRTGWAGMLTGRGLWGRRLAGCVLGVAAATEAPSRMGARRQRRSGLQKRRGSAASAASLRAGGCRKARIRGPGRSVGHMGMVGGTQAVISGPEAEGRDPHTNPRGRS